MALALVLLLYGLAFLTVFQAKLTAVATQWGAEKQELRLKLLESMQYMRRMGVQQKLQRKVRTYVDNIMQTNTQMAVNPAVLDLLSSPLRSEIIGQSIGPVLRSCPLFQACPEEFIRHLCGMSKAQRAGVGDRVVEQGSLSDTMFFIVGGTVAMRVSRHEKTTIASGFIQEYSYQDHLVKQRTEERLSLDPQGYEVETGQMGPGQFFGEYGFIRDAMTHWCSVDCKTHAQFIVLQKESFLDAMKKYPKISRMMQNTWLQPELIDCWDLIPFMSATSNTSIASTAQDDAAERVVLWQGDITQLKVGAIVNSANTTLLCGSGLEAAIHLAAGQELKDSCRLLEGCRPGEAKATPGFRLQGTDHIFHTVGPPGEVPEVLRRCYINCLQLAELNECRTIAFCPVGTGNAGYPKRQAADIAVRTVAAWLSGERGFLKGKREKTKGRKKPAFGTYLSGQDLATSSKVPSFPSSSTCGSPLKVPSMLSAGDRPFQIERVVFAVLDEEDKDIYAESLRNYFWSATPDLVQMTERKAEAMLAGSISLSKCR